MKSTTSIRAILVSMAVTLALVSAAHASAARTFVSSTGSDANAASNCVLANPCRTFAGAYAVTSAGGEIIVLNGGGYGPITITTSVTISGTNGAIIGVPSNTIGVTINAAASDVVTLNNIQISGAGAANTTGIQLNTGRLVVQNSIIRKLTLGLTIAANTKSDVMLTDIIGNTTGISTAGTGTNFDSFTVYGPTQVRIHGGAVVDNTTAFLMNTPGNDAFQVFPTILISSPITTGITGNATLTACTGISGASPPPCDRVGTYGNSNLNNGQVN